MRFILLTLLIFSHTSNAVITVDEWLTPEGSKVLFTQTKGLPIVDIQLAFDAASSRDGINHGIAFLTNDLIGTATKELNEEQIISNFESVGAIFSQDSLRDMSVFNLRTISESSTLNQSITMFSNVVSNPVFTVPKLNRLKKQVSKTLSYNEKAVAAVAKDLFYKELFGNHPYAHNTYGTLESIKNIDINKIKDFYKNFYVAKNMNIAIVGDITRSKAEQIANQISIGLNTGNKPLPNPQVSPTPSQKNINLYLPSEQTHIHVGHSGINRTHPDFYPLYLGNHILGSGITSVLSKKLRDDAGLTYNIYSLLGPMASNGYFLISMQTANKSADDAEGLILNTFKSWLSGNITDQHVSNAKSNIAGTWTLGTSTNAQLVGFLSIMGFYDLPNDWINTFVDKIQLVTKDDLSIAFNNLIDVNKLIIVKVGGN